MKIKLLLVGLILGIISLSCKDEPKLEGIEERNEVEEIKELTSQDEIEDYFEDTDSTSAKINNFKSVNSFYTQREFMPFWNDKESREDLFRSIETIEYDGLFFEDYHGEELQQLLSSLNSDNEEQNLRAEILLTDAFIDLAHDLAVGKLNPKEIYEVWGTELNTINNESLFKRLEKGEKASSILAELAPDHVVYKSLKKALKNYRDDGIKENSSTVIASGKLVKPGEDNDRIPDVASRLFELGYYTKSPDSVGTRYTKKLQTALEDFQKDHGLNTDGVIGNTTIENLNLTTEDRYHQILVNMERWRWYPRDLGEHYIIVNIPDYELYVVSNGDTIRNHKTMVGTEARKTPVFSDEIDYIIYNPTWTIPPTIMKNDVIPGASRDVGYLRKKNIKMYDRSGKEVDPSAVNWNSSSPRSYTYRQPAGPSNPLGLVKIIYPNEYMIYLHDTPSKRLFEKNARAQSSGCVRVENVLDLAKYLIEDQKEFDDEKIDEILKSGKTTQIAMKQKIKVHHFYWTTYQKKDTTRFIDDIYDLDKKLWDLLKPKA
ncbi:murein L,D-transpeptidase YcbB/YkuD [Gramella sp. Hel_I_59]|uniref:L,D-transpeptidase family protein n=1 Tax=Gramella sp. Hel_I_59 TaxID=1249978 RepID=UPI0011521DFE|nr:L,D-transpeptidase family protein [Gramella sp. Hel_I_59]TQI71640.1 murein L,D-transpeptidase YcbB/YkuD [Gramella sp. Hel_I_59]